MTRLPKILLAIAFVGMVASAWYLGHGAIANEAPVADAAEALARHGFRFTELGRIAGVDAVHHAPTFDARLAHIMPQVASMGAAVAVSDFDNDGLADMYVVDSGEGARNHLYRNRGDGHFDDVAGSRGVADVNRPGTGVSTGALWGDYDNDGDDDLFVNKWGRPELFRNDGGTWFERVTEGSGLPEWINSSSAVWFDYDRDGLLDLFLGGYYDEQVDLWHLASTRMMPESFEYATNGGAKHLYRNLGGGRFRDVAAEVGLTSTRWALAAAAADLRGSGWSDLVIANDYGVSEYYRNDGGRFTEIGAASGIGERPKSGMNVSFGDVFGDGRSAVYISNISEEGILLQGNNLWVPRAGRPAEAPSYENLASTMGVDLGGWSFGAQFADLDNDGHQDLFLTNGFVSASPQRSYWYDYSKIAVGDSRIISDAALWPPMEDMSLAGHQPKKVWKNDGAGGFVDVARAVGVSETFDGRAVATADFWNRGVADVVVANQKAPLSLYRNDVAPDRHWIDLELTGDPARGSNKSAIGARVTVEADGRTQLQHVVSASGFSAQNQRRLHFGLGPADRVEKVTIHWPSGQVQELLAPAVDRLHRVSEAAGATAGAGDRP